MEPGRLRLPSGFSATCSYQLDSESEGRLALPSALYLPHRDSEDATLTMADGHERAIHIIFAPTVGEATFTFLS
jgi:hypothetical protein